MLLTPDDVRIVAIHATGHESDVSFEDLSREQRLLGYFECTWHYVITRDGKVHKGRPDDTPGIHLPGHDRESIGIALVGSHDFTDHQYTALAGLQDWLRTFYSDADFWSFEPGREET